MEIGIILNPKSRANLKHPARASEYEKLGMGIVEVKETASLSDLVRTAKSFKKKKVPYLGISGGDGTIHQVITAFIHAYHPDPIPPVLLLGDGTMNNIAHSLGISGGGKSVLRRFMKNYNNRRISMVWKDTMSIDDKYCFLFGCGMTTNFLVEAYRGKKGYLKNLDVIRQCIHEVVKSNFVRDKKTLKLLHPLEAAIYSGGKRLPLKDLLVVLSGTVDQVGMGFRPLSRSSHKKGHFHTIATDVNPWKILLYIGLIGTGKGHFLRDKRYLDLVTDDIRIKASAPFEYTMDGDMYSCDGDLTVKTGPEVQFIIP